MIDSLQITNFRGFKEVKLKNLSRINVIVGDNGSGKTALLESLFLAAGPGPELYLRTRAWRGSGDKFILGIDREQYEAIWNEIFYELDQNREVRIRLTDSDSSVDRDLRIYYDATQSSLLPLDMNVRTTYEGGDIHPITFEWKLPSGEKKSVVTLTPQSGFQMPQIHDHYPMMFLTAATQFIPEENAKRFSFLSRRHRDTSVLKVIQSIFPLVQDLSVEIVSGSPNLYATVSGLDEKMSIGALSGGLTKFLAIAFGIASFPRGAVLIDEIENGFFYKKYADVWKGITELAEENETQMFISSHSIECLQAALPVISQHPSLFTLLRTERRPEQCVVRYFSGKDFEAGIEQRVDFR